MSEDEQPQETVEMSGLWESALSTLEGRIKPHNFEMWLRPIQCKAVDGGRITLSAPSKWIKEWFQDNYQSIVLDALRAQTNQEFEILFEVREAESLRDPTPVPVSAPVTPTSESKPGPFDTRDWPAPYILAK